MNRAELLGARLVMIVRREYEQEALLAEIRQERRDLLLQIRDMEAGSLYSSTGEFPRVTSDPVSPASAVTERFERVRNPDPIPFRADHTDGGNTFRLTPIGDTVVNMPAVQLDSLQPVQVPMIRCPTCNETFPHVHGEGGRIHAQTSE